MPASRFRTSSHRIESLIFDLVCTILFGLWLGGVFGVQNFYPAQYVISIRRVLIILPVSFYFLRPVLRDQSYFFRGIQFGGRVLSYSLTRWSIYFLALVGACLLGIQQTLALQVSLFDTGKYHQLFWNLAHGFGPTTTLLSGQEFLVHYFSPAFMLLVPVFKIAEQSPLFLPILHACCLFGAGAAWMVAATGLKGTSEKFNQTLAGSVLIFILCLDSLWITLRRGFREDSIGVLSFSWACALLLMSLPHQKPAIQNIKRQNLKRFFAFILFMIAAVCQVPMYAASIHWNLLILLWPFLALATLVILAKVRSTQINWICALVAAFIMSFDPIAEYEKCSSQAKELVGIRNLIQEIPQDASLAADDRAGLWVAGRRWITRWPDTAGLPHQCPQYILVQNSERGTITERGVQAVMSRCLSETHERHKNSDLAVPSPEKRLGSWAIYEIKGSHQY